MRNILSIASITFKEGLREKVFYGSIILFSLILLLNYILGQIAYGDQGKVLRDVGLAGLELSAVLVTVFFMLNSFWRDRESKMLDVYLSRFLRHEFLLGRFLGVFSVTAVFLFIGLICFSLLLFFHKAFYFSLLAGVFFIFLKLVILLSFALFFATFISSQVLAYLLTIAVYITGSISRNALDIINQEGSPLSIFFFKYFYLLFPNLDKFEIKLAVAYGNAPQFSYVAISVIYALAYAGFVLSIANLIFKIKEQ